MQRDGSKATHDPHRSIKERVVQKIAFLIWFSFLSLSLASLPDSPNPGTNRHYRDFVTPLLAGGLIGAQEKTLALRVITENGEIPEPGPKLEIHSNNGVITLESDADGYIKYPFNLSLFRENPIVIKLDNNIAFELRLSSVLRPGVKQLRELSVGDKQYIDCGSCRLWYPTGHLEIAKEISKDLKAACTFIRRELGVTPIFWGINLVAQDLSKVNYTTLQDYPKWYTWSYTIDEITSSGARTNIVHEWVEATLGECVGLKQSSVGGSNRFVFDGLADYISIRFTKYVPAFYLPELQALLNTSVNTVDLPNQFRWQPKQYQNPEELTDELIQFRAGYPLSYAFWEDLSQKYGRDIPKRFISQLQQGDKSDTESCIHTLEQLTGSNQIQAKLETIDVGKVMELIQDMSKSLNDIEQRNAMGRPKGRP
jgi:hypothetical protein